MGNNSHIDRLIPKNNNKEKDWNYNNKRNNEENISNKWKYNNSVREQWDNNNINVREQWDSNNSDNICKWWTIIKMEIIDFLFKNHFYYYFTFQYLIFIY